MNKKEISKSVMYVFIAAFVLSSIAVSNTNTAFAFIGFLLGDNESDTGASTTSTAEDQTPSSSYTKAQSSSSLQNAECHSPHGNIIDSCNSGDLSDSIDDGYTISDQYQ